MLSKIGRGLSSDSQLNLDLLDIGDIHRIEPGSIAGSILEVDRKRAEPTSYPLHRLLNLLAGRHQTVAYRHIFAYPLSSPIGLDGCPRLLLDGMLLSEVAHALDDSASVRRTVALDLQAGILLPQQRQLHLELSNRRGVARRLLSF